jgi:ketosteroid isomerase-like protein
MRFALPLLVLAVFAGCGADEPSMSDGERGVRDAAERYAEAVRAGDAQAICDEQVSAELSKKFTDLGGDCVRDFFAGAVKDGGPKFQLVVNSVKLVGNRALATGYVVEKSGKHDDGFPFVREADGRWRVTLTPPR